MRTGVNRHCFAKMGAPAYHLWSAAVHQRGADLAAPAQEHRLASPVLAVPAWAPCPGLPVSLPSQMRPAAAAVVQAGSPAQLQLHAAVAAHGAVQGPIAAATAAPVGLLGATGDLCCQAAKCSRPGSACAVQPATHCPTPSSAHSLLAAWQSAPWQPAAAH